MRRKNRKQKKVKVSAGKKKDGFEAEDEEEDVSGIDNYVLMVDIHKIMFAV